MPPFAYEMHEMAYLALAPTRALSDAARTWLEHPGNPLSYTAAGRNLAASAKIFEWVAWERPFCKLLHFEKQFDTAAPEPRQKLLIVAPMSGHHATLLRGTVEAFLPFYDVYITDWVDARTIPLVSGRFDLDDYIDYLIAMLHFLG